MSCRGSKTMICYELTSDHNEFAEPYSRELMTRLLERAMFAASLVLAATSVRISVKVSSCICKGRGCSIIVSSLIGKPYMS